MNLILSRRKKQLEEYRQRKKADREERRRNLKAEAVNQVIELYSQGKTRIEIRKLTNHSRSFIAQVLSLCPGQHLPSDEGQERREDFLEPSDEAMVQGFWVPSPTRIREMCATFRMSWSEDEKAFREGKHIVLTCKYCGRQRHRLTTLPNGECVCMKPDYVDEDEASQAPSLAAPTATEPKE